MAKVSEEPANRATAAGVSGMDGIMEHGMSEAAPVQPACGRVAVGMSGGVDSSVAAALLLAAGYDVVGVTCVFVDDEVASAAIRDAGAVCRHLGIEHRIWECCDLFEGSVIRPFVDAYGAGLTPSPCVTCNAACKIPSLLAAADSLECNLVATGHYAQVECVAGRFAIRRSYTDKDQSYMLAMLTQGQLSRVVFPLGALDKAKVREIAIEQGLPVAHRAESQDICFIAGSHVDFLLDHGVQCLAGDIVDERGAVLGRHEGLVRYTLGQRKGIGIGGAPEPYFAIGKDPVENRLVVGPLSATRIKAAVVSGLNWQAADPDCLIGEPNENDPLHCTVKLRYRSQAVGCRIAAEGCGDCLRAVFDEPQPITAPGQFAVFYRGDAVLAGGVIERVVSA